MTIFAKQNEFYIMRFKKIIVVILILADFQFLSAQLNIGGKPKSFNPEYKLKSQNKIPEIFILPKLNNEKLKNDAEAGETKDKPWQFGKNISVDIDLKKTALAEKLSKGTLYRLMIVSENALTLNFRFKKYTVPDGAVLYLYNQEKTAVLGGFTSANNQQNGIFATTLLKGDKIIFEYYEPNDAAFSGKLVINRVTHGFRGILDMSKSFGNSGDCNMNVACDDGTYADEIRSVCMLVTGGSGFCSASLINNTKEDGKPYILTANHCYEDPSDIVFWFNWQSATGENPSISPDYDALSGAVLRARDYESDFCLFELNDIPPYTYNVYYAGWNNEDIPSLASVCVHHPSAD
ncbi:MAG: S1 family peptidase, partial [Bacteroidales bacterium]|nr:S1 family peptidase [Bacteroidales bacterium]